MVAIPNACQCKESALLTKVLRRFAYLDRAYFCRGIMRGWFILVEPYQEWSWGAFFDKYPNARNIAERLGGRVGYYPGCPSFDSRECLVDWLATVLKLPRGTANLLKLEK
ncbi:MAG: hypothetical protein DRG59_10895 [Deltaproteobacteria bacterium]|nr:MAG: hypothetical protein DRG59_10895 [Deltaproteobacteria bacterium]